MDVPVDVREFVHKKSEFEKSTTLRTAQLHHNSNARLIVIYTNTKRVTYVRMPQIKTRFLEYCLSHGFGQDSQFLDRATGSPVFGSEHGTTRTESNRLT